MKQTEIAWLAGLFEGEGNIAIAKNGGTRLTIRMCDRDIIDRIDAIFPAPSIQVVVPQPTPKGNQPRTQYAWRISDPKTVAEILVLLLPWFGERRAAKAEEVLEHLATRPGVGGFHRSKTHCAQGHEYTPENTYVRPSTTHRHCRTCRAAWAKASQERHSQGG